MRYIAATLEQGNLVEWCLKEGFEGKISIRQKKWLDEKNTLWFLAMSGNVPVSCVGMTPMRMVKSDQKDFWAFMCNSVCTIPQYRGQGIYTKLDEFMIDYMLNEHKFDTLYGFTNPDAYGPHIRAGWKKQCDVDLLICNSDMPPLDQYLPPLLWDIKVDKFDDVFRKWRMKKPGSTYHMMSDSKGEVVYKRESDRVVILWCTDYRDALLKVRNEGTQIGIWASRGSDMHQFLIDSDQFWVDHTRSLIWAGRYGSCVYNPELADNDVF